MKIYVVLAPKGEGALAMNRYRFIKRPIHRPVRTGRKAKFDPGVDMLLGSKQSQLRAGIDPHLDTYCLCFLAMQNLNVTLDATSSDSYQVTNVWHASLSTPTIIKLIHYTRPSPPTLQQPSSENAPKLRLTHLLSSRAGSALSPLCLRKARKNAAYQEIVRARTAKTWIHCLTRSMK